MGESVNSKNLVTVLTKLLSQEDGGLRQETKKSIYLPTLLPNADSSYVARTKKIAQYNQGRLKEILARDMVNQMSNYNSGEKIKQGLYPKVYTNTNPSKRALPSERFPQLSSSLDQGAVGNRQSSLYRPRGTQVVDHKLGVRNGLTVPFNNQDDEDEDAEEELMEEENGYYANIQDTTAPPLAKYRKGGPQGFPFANFAAERSNPNRLGYYNKILNQQ